MNRKRLRVALFAVGLLLMAAQLPAPVHPDCNNQPYLNCGLTCTNEGCIFIIGPSPEDHMFDYCYVVDGAGCLGGTYNRCCN